jgi:hypothetical protein
MIDWVAAVTVFLAAIAGAVGGSARPGDGLRDIPQVFMRSPGQFLASGLGASVVVVVGYALRDDPTRPAGTGVSRRFKQPTRIDRIRGGAVAEELEIVWIDDNVRFERQ